MEVPVGSAAGGGGRGGGGAGGARPNKVRNRAPASIQITVEQLLLEAQALQDKPPVRPKQLISDAEELAEHRASKRKEFEEKLRMHRDHMPTYMNYARWEEGQMEYQRARNVYERALEANYQDVRVWMRYAEMEMKGKFVNRARNVFNRAVTLLPRVDLFWFKFTFLEEMVGNVNNARAVFERWMEWEPPESAWLAYIQLEVRQGEVERARAIYERFVACHVTQSAFLRFAKWEERHGQLALARRVFERAVAELLPSDRDEQLFLEFARFEQRCREFERVRVIFRFALENLPKELTSAVHREFAAFEKQYGSADSVEATLLARRREQYEEALRANAFDYDAWFDFIRLEEAEGELERIRDVYERAIAQVPPVAEKRFWRRYIYLWINYALFEELAAKDVERTREVYRACLELIPHRTFTFGKIWILAAHFEVRQRDLARARKLLGTSIGLCPKEKVFRAYIDLELQLGEVDRCRTLYGKYLDFVPHNCQAWIRFADLEKSVGEDERARAVYELAVGQPVLDTPEVLWKAFLDFEIEREEFARARQLYERLLDRTQHVKVWLSFAAFESGSAGELDRARAVYERADRVFKEAGKKEERALVLDTWLKFEVAAAAALGRIDSPELRAVEAKQPKPVIRRRDLVDAAGNPIGQEEFVDYEFPEDKVNDGASRLRSIAQNWKLKQMMMARKAKEETGTGAGEEALDGSGSGEGGGAGGGGEDEPLSRKRKADEALDGSEE